MNEQQPTELEPVRIRVPVEIELQLEIQVSTDGGDTTVRVRPIAGPSSFAASTQRSTFTRSSSARSPTVDAAAGVTAEAVAAGSIEDKAYSRFNMQALRENNFSWSSALTCCVASHLAYEPAKTIEQTFRNRFSLPCKYIEKNNTQCFVAHDDQTVLVAFRGTENLPDWISDLKIASTATRMGMVHYGFYQAFQYVRQALEDLIEPLAASRSLVITGHSLGGALAVIAIGYWQAKYKIRSVYTYGGPRVGLASFGEFARDRQIDKKLYRLVNADDIVTRVPPRYIHVGHLYRFDSAGLVTQLESPATSSARKIMTETVTVDTDVEQPALSAEEFELLKAECEATADVSAQDALAESLFPNYFSDHFLLGYLTKILKVNPLTSGT